MRLVDHDQTHRVEHVRLVEDEAQERLVGEEREIEATAPDVADLVAPVTARAPHPEPEPVLVERVELIPLLGHDGAVRGKVETTLSPRSIIFAAASSPRNVFPELVGADTTRETPERRAVLVDRAQLQLVEPIEARAPGVHDIAGQTKRSECRDVVGDGDGGGVLRCRTSPRTPPP